MKRILIIAAFLVLLPQLSSASPITWRWDGVVTGNSSSPFPDLPSILPIGTPMQILMSFESDAPDLCPDALHGQYHGHPAFITAGAHTFTSDFWLEVNSAVGSCSGFFGFDLRLPNGWHPTDPTDIEGARIAFAAGQLAALVGFPWPDGSIPALPSDPYPMSLGGGTFFSASGFTTAVPEPTTLLLFSGGIATLIRRRRFASQR